MPNLTIRKSRDRTKVPFIPQSMRRIAFPVCKAEKLSFAQSRHSAKVADAVDFSPF